ncbi:unnamed protein product [Arctia plantaginis]|uniref:Uncharacterized protein n=1 Tax=Arctia plantaginis TaxID=874455 RepID=A0A8S1BGH5_ARCPL|nr:unnamed protein product [Arctia plantaginis]
MAGCYQILLFHCNEKYSTLLLHTDENQIITVNQNFEWPVVRPINPGEVVTVQLLCRMRWGAPRVLGVYRLGLQILVTDGQLCLTDTLVDDRNKAVPNKRLDLEITKRP